MRGNAARQVEMLTAVTPDALIPQGHPMRRIKPMVDRALAQMSSTFDRRYAQNGRASIPPEHLLKAGLLMALFLPCIQGRSERQCCERLEYDLLFKWFLDLNIMDHSFDYSVFAKNRSRLLEAEVSREFLLAIVEQARQQGLLSAEHFSVDGTLLEAWASLKSFRPRDGDPPAGDGSGDHFRADGGGRNPEVDFRGQRRRNETHVSTPESTKNPEARLAKKGPGKAARLCFEGHVLMDNRQGLVVDVMLTPAGGTSERDAAIVMLGAVPGADRGYDTREFIRRCRTLKVTPRVAQKQHSAIDGRTTRHEGYRVSQRVRKRVEEVFGWIKTVAGGRKLRYRGVDRNQMWAELTVAGYNLVRLAKVAAVPA